ncbi:MAG: class I tRNA ligase family protein [bacterium]|nr:class I tRNA ligase family protein [bacterium]
MTDKKDVRSERAKKEQEILELWRENRIFEKTLEKNKDSGKEFIFYEGPPTANGKPGIHHLESRAFKDAIPRYKTMRGFYVRRKGGWDTHGLPVEIQVEKELGLKSKKEVEEYGVEKFNQKCKESVWKYVREWEEFTERVGYWIDLEHPYVTYKPYYIESVWNIVKKIDEQGLLYKDYKVVPWCPRCGTALSSHELAQGYETVKDLSITAKFQIRNPKSEINSKLKIQNGKPTYMLAWTTTPWTLPGNVALAVNPNITYVRIGITNQESGIKEEYILAKERIGNVLKDKEFEIIEEFTGGELVGLEYEPLYPFLAKALNPEALNPAFKVYSADFVTTEDGTGIVHTAVMYGQDDFQLGTKEGLPKYHLVNEDGTFKKETGFLSGKQVKTESTDVEIIKDLAHRGLLFAKEKYEHSYPHCWRCHSALIYFARDSWYIKMSDKKIKDKLVKENKKINWEPEYIKEGRFGEWLKDIKDWAISRERYWGTPLPVWICPQIQTGKISGSEFKIFEGEELQKTDSKQKGCGKTRVVGSFEEIFKLGAGRPLTRLILLRHGESQKNIDGIFDSERDKYPLTKEGKKQAKEAGKKLAALGVDALYSSPVLRARETADIVAENIKIKNILDDRLWEVKSGQWDGKEPQDSLINRNRLDYNGLPDEKYYLTPRGQTGESWKQVEDRMSDFVREILEKHKGETVAIVSHEGPLIFLLRYLKNLSLQEVTNLWQERRTFKRGLLGGYAEASFVYVDNSTGKELDPHKPRVDEISLICKCGGEMKRVKEVMDVWFDSGAMPFAEDHYPFKNKDYIDEKGYPADYICEAIDQTRGWFYTLHAIGVLMGKGAAYKNVISLGHLLEAKGKKMSKSLGNVIDPKEQMEKYGADALRFWMYSVNQPGEAKNYDEKTVDEIVKKVFNLADNVLQFYLLYSKDGTHNMEHATSEKGHVLDKWVLARLGQLVGEVTEGLDNYKLLEPARAIREFIGDLSQWYLRRSRDRIKEGDKEALTTLRHVLIELSKLLAPFTPFFAEHLYQSLHDTCYTLHDKSVHLEEWPKHGTWNMEHGTKMLEDMEEVRRIVSLALEQRAKASIKVRQPLNKLKVKSLKFKVGDEQMINLVKDEVNVKEVVLDDTISGEVEIDTEITPKLKEEGTVREFIRAVQDLRKKKGLNPSDSVVLKVKADDTGKAFLEKNKSEIQKTAGLKDMSFEDVATENIAIENLFFSLDI